jgi:hypothetical protein
MKYLPFEHLIYKTDLTEKEAIKKLSDYIEAKRSSFIFNNKSTKEYEGFINKNSFEINRIIKNRNSFLPQIMGTIQTSNDETQIEVKMRLHWAVSGFLIFWCLGILVSIIHDILNSSEKISIEFLIPILMLVFAYLLTMYGFKSESKKAKEDLRKIFEVK